MVQLSLFNCERLVSNSSRVLGILLQGLYAKTAKNERWLSKNTQIRTGKLAMLRFKYIDLSLQALHRRWRISTPRDHWAEVGWRKWSCFQLQLA